MPVEATCPSCEGKFRLPDAAAGKKIRCPKCKGPLEVPPLSAEPAVAPSPPSDLATPVPTENLKSTWRSASQEASPPEPLRKEAPKEIARPQPQPSAQNLFPPTSAPTTTSKNPTVTKTKSAPPPETIQKKVTPPQPVAPLSPPTPVPKPKAPEPVPAPVAPPVFTPPEPVAPLTPAAPGWFLKGEDGETFGPVDRRTLDSWHDEGRMTADSQLLLDGTEQWQWASDLYPDLEEPTLEPEPAVPVSPATDSSEDIEPPRELATAVSLQAKSKARVIAPVEDDDTEEQLSPHSKPVAVLLGFTLGMLGIHRFYLGYVGIGLAMLFTLGGLMIWSITDTLRILFGHVTDSEGLKLRD